jgi:hypothetical protein
MPSAETGDRGHGPRTTGSRSCSCLLDSTGRGDGQEGRQQPQACPGSVIHGLLNAAEMAGPFTAEEEPADCGGSGRRSRDSGAGRSAHVRFLWLSQSAGRRGSRFVPGRSKNASSSDGFFSMCRSWNEACAAGLRRHCRGAEAHGQRGREADRPSAGRLAVRWDGGSVARIPAAGNSVSDVPMKPQGQTRACRYGELRDRNTTGMREPR